MDVRTMKHAAKLAEWSEKVQACRSSGLPVKEWCEQNNICPKTYYTWERVYLAEVSKQLVIPEPLSAARSSQIVRVDPSQMPDEVEVIGAAPAIQPTSNVQITLRYGAMSVEMPAGMEIAQIADLMKALGADMLDFSGITNYYIRCGYTDMRKQIDGLAALVRLEYRMDLNEHSIFLFCGRKADRIKALHWDGTGYVLLIKRLAEMRFQWPRNEEELKLVTKQQFRWLMEGLSIEQTKAFKPGKAATVC